MKSINKLPSFLPRTSLGEAIDKLCSLVRKVYFGEEDAIEELNYLIEHLDKMPMDKHIPRPGKFIVTVLRLGMINFEIWNREHEFRRRGEVFPNGDAGKIAKEVRMLNKKRVHYKNEINKLTRLGFREFKTRHASE